MKKVVIVLIVLCICMTGCSIKKVEKLTDAEKFANEFNISKSNPYLYSSIEDIEKIFSSGTGIVFFATPDQEGSLKAAEFLTETAKKEEIENIYYYNPNALKDSSSKKYKNILKKVEEYIGKKDIKEVDLPSIYSIKDGKIVSYSNYFSKKEQLSEEKLSQKKIKQIKKEYSCILNYQECTNS